MFGPEGYILLYFTKEIQEPSSYDGILWLALKPPDIVF